MGKNKKSDLKKSTEIGGTSRSKSILENNLFHSLDQSKETDEPKKMSRPDLEGENMIVNIENVLAPNKMN